MGMNVSFRDVDEDAFREFKAVIARLGLKAGSALSEAMRYYSEYKMKQEKKSAFKLWKPHDWGSGSEHDSSRVDEFVYGWKR